MADVAGGRIRTGELAAAIDVIGRDGGSGFAPAARADARHANDTGESGQVQARQVVDEGLSMAGGESREVFAHLVAAEMQGLLLLVNMQIQSSAGKDPCCTVGAY